MVNVNRVKGEIKALGFTQKEVYEAIGLTRRQWNIRLEKKKFNSDEIYGICKFIGMDKLPIFFEDEVA